MSRFALTALTLALACAAAPPGALASGTPEQELAARYAPIVALQEQKEPCGKGEPYRPSSVDVVLGKPDVVLRGPGAGHPVVKSAPTAADLFDKGEGYYLDLPGNPLSPGCTFEQALDRWADGQPSIAYAHLAREAGRPGKLALQYWLYYGFNDFNDKHESDWEMIQIVFPAGDARRALATSPVEFAYSQHAGGERADWNDDKLEKQGTHPIVYPGAGSHANYYSSALWLGRGAAEGFGCDDTRGPSVRLATHAIVLPTSVSSRTEPFAWLGFTGRWGQLEEGVNNGPTGPATKEQWLHPIRWQEDSLRNSSVRVPAARSLGPTVTGFFCGAVAAGSQALLLLQTSPWPALAVVLAVLALAVTLVRRTRWAPPDPVPLRKRRAAGQIVRASRRLYGRHQALFVGIGAVFLPLGALFAGVQWLLFDSWLRGLVDLAGHRSGVSAVLGLLVGGFGVLVAAVLVQAATAVAVAELADGRKPTVRLAYRIVFARARVLVLAFARAVAITVLLIVTLVGIPVAIERAVRWTFLVQECVLEGRDAAAARRQSVRLVRGDWWRTFALVASTNVTVLLTGLLVGLLFLFFVSSLSLSVINVIGALVYMIGYPYIGIVTTLLYYDRTASRQPAMQPSPVAAALPSS